MITVLFACVQNAGRSQIAAALFNRSVDPNKARAISAGTHPASHVHPEVRDAMKQRGIDLSLGSPQKLTLELATTANWLITMGCGDECPVVPGARRDDWPLQDPKGQSADVVERIIADIEARVLALIAANGWAADASKRPTIRQANPATDAEAIARIYNHYVTSTTVTFEEQPIDVTEVGQRMIDVAQADLPYLVAESDRDIVGYAYATRWKARSAYRFSVEISVYLDPARLGVGLGSALYQDLFTRLHSRGVHAVIGGIALPNDSSIALHEKFGLKKVAHFAEVGFKFGRWIDVGYWQTILGS